MASHRIVLAGCLAGGALLGAAPAGAVEAIPLPEERIAEPAERAAQGYGWQMDFQSGTVLLRPDATLRAYDNSGGTGAVATVFDPGAGAVAPTPATGAPAAAADAPFTGNLTGVQIRLGGDVLWREGLSAASGADWSLEEGNSTGLMSLVARDDREAAIRQITIRRSSYADAVGLLSTTRGVYAVLAEPRSGVEGPGGRIVDERGRTVAALPKVTPKTAVALDDDTVLVVGNTRDGGRPLARMSPGGRVSYPRIKPPHAAELREPLQTAGGVFVRLLDSSVDWNEDSFARISQRGVLGKRRKLDDLGIPWPDRCEGMHGVHSVERSVVGPTGSLVLVVDCWNDAPKDPDYEGRRMVVLLGPDLRFRRLVATTSDRWGGFREVGTLPDGRLYVTRADGSIGAIALPGALPVTRGRLGDVTARGTDRAAVRVSCRQPYGAICSGRIELRAPDGELFGWAPYSLPGRPGKHRSVVDVTVPRTAPPGTFEQGVPAGASASLLPLPPQFQRGSAQPPS